MTVYADVVFAVNTVVNYLLLLLGARLTGYPTKPWRAFCGASVGGGYAVCVLLPTLAFLAAPWGKAVCFVLMCMTAYGIRKKAVRPGAVSFLCGGALAGFVLLLSRILPQEIALFGSVYYPLASRMLVLMAGGFYLAAAILLAGSMRHGAGDVAQILLEHEGRKIRVGALRDSGNTLYDAVTGKPVVVLEWQRGAELLQMPLSAEDAQDAPSAMERLKKQHPQEKFRLIAFRAVGTENGLLLAVPCTAKVDRRKKTAVLAAFSPGPVSDGGGYEALIGGTLF